MFLNALFQIRRRMKIFRQEEGRLFVRTLLGYRSEERAWDQSKILWKMDYATRVERIGSRWYVWRAIP